MRILGLDTATFTASAAVIDVGDDGAVSVVVAGDLAPGAIGPGERLVPFVAELLAGAGLTLAMLDRPLWLASSLAALAWDAAVGSSTGGEEVLLVPALDARRAEIYVGFYRRAGRGVVAIAPERVLPPAALADAVAAIDAGPAIVFGDALPAHADALASLPVAIVRRPDLRATPSAIAVAAVAAAGPRTDVTAHGAPAYIRPSEAEVMYPDGVPGARPRS